MNNRHKEKQIENKHQKPANDNSGYIDDLRQKLQTLIRSGVSVEMCLILEDMLDHDELAWVVDDGIPKWSSKGSNRLLDRIRGVEDLTESLLLGLLVDGDVEFMLTDQGGLNVRWKYRKRVQNQAV